MCDSGLPETMWEFAAKAAVLAYNITPHSSINYNVPTLKFAENLRCNLDRIKRFGCIAYVKLPRIESKFKAVAVRTVLVGYIATGYILWHPGTRKFLESRHVKFNEKLVYRNVYGRDKNYEKFDIKNLEFEPDKPTEIELDQSLQAPESVEIEKTVSKKRGRTKKSNTKKIIEKKTDKNCPVTRSQLKRKIVSDEQIEQNSNSRRVEDISCAARYLNVQETDELSHMWLTKLQKDPTSFKEAMESDAKENWNKAIREELDSMKTNEVWRLVDRPKPTSAGKKPNVIDSKWVFKRKVDADGSINFKARLVIRGFKDKNMYDLKETYAPVSRLSLIRSALAIINKHNLHVCQMDVKTAFLNSELDEEVYMEIPDGLEVPNDIKQSKVCKLEKSMYGLKVSPKKWNEKFSREARKLGLQNDLHDPCLFTWRHRGKMAFVVLYVDDMLIASNDIEKLNEIKRLLSSVFEMKDLGEPKNFLGMTIQRNKNSREMIIHQAEYTEKMLEKFDMNSVHPHDTLTETRQKSERKKNLKLKA